MAVPPVINLDSSPSSTQAKQPPSSHRLATVSASQALQNLQESGSSFISTGLKSLDASLTGSHDTNNGGLERGKITEIWGPSGSGKTVLALQAMHLTINAGSSAMWVDAHRPAILSRPQASVMQTAESSDQSRDWPKQICHLVVPTVSHLLAMILHPQPDFFPSDLSLLVIDDLDTLVNLDYPRFQISTSSKPEQQKWQSSRRYAILGSIVSGLNKLAMLHNIAVIVTTSCATRSRAEDGLGAALVPGVGGAEWDSGIWNRLVLFRDFGRRFVGIQKSQGKNLVARDGSADAGRLVCFEVKQDGTLQEYQTNEFKDGAADRAAVKQRLNPVKPPKRSFDEIADSEDEDVDEYGWVDSDEHALAIENLAGNEQSVTS